MLWEKCRDEIISLGGEVILNCKVHEIEQVEKKWRLKFSDGSFSHEANDLISTAPIGEIFKKHQTKSFRAGYFITWRF